MTKASAVFGSGARTGSNPKQSLDLVHSPRVHFMKITSITEFLRLDDGLNMTVSLDQLAGSWRLLSAWHEFETRQRKYPYGMNPVGSLVVTADSRITSIVTADLPAVSSPEELYRSMEAYSGRFGFDGSELVTTVDVSSMPGWVRNELRHVVSLSPTGHQLFMTRPEQGYPLYPAVPATMALTWLRNV
jgi:hypothetical protein